VRVAYFVQSHHQPEQVLRLLATLRDGSPDCALVVGHCPAGEPLPAARLAAVDAHLFHHRQRGRRGFWSLLEPWFDAVELLAARGVSYDWLVYLSGQDYPVLPLARSEAYLRDSSHDGYLSWRSAHAPSPDGRRQQGRLRYEYQYTELPRLVPLLRLVRKLNGIQKVWHVHLTYGPRIGLRAASSPFRDGFHPYVGLQWTTLRRACAEQVTKVARENEPLRRYYERTLCPDEGFVQTVLVNDGRFDLCNDALRYVDFAGTRDGHPRTLRLADGPGISSGAYHFARKVDPGIDPALLDWLDREVLGRSGTAPAPPGPPGPRQSANPSPP
jgi:hypothetical protein